ncbi:MAG: hypothetical protein HEQ38_04470 [Gemmatimonas sp.]|nr:hypothetical protein [Gemmatimonas sp.]
MTPCSKSHTLTRRCSVGLTILALLAARSVRAQSAQVPEPTEATRRHLVARRALAKIVIDGRLDEASWQAAPVAADFFQVRPDFNTTTKYPSEVRVLMMTNISMWGRSTATARG